MDASVTAAALRQSLDSSQPPLVIDVRRQPAFLGAPDLIRGALRRDPGVGMPHGSVKRAQRPVATDGSVLSGMFAAGGYLRAPLAITASSDRGRLLLLFATAKPSIRSVRRARMPTA